jgi:hypothetical protein
VDALFRGLPRNVKEFQSEQGHFMLLETLRRAARQIKIEAIRAATEKANGKVGLVPARGYPLRLIRYADVGNLRVSALDYGEFACRGSYVYDDISDDEIDEDYAILDDVRHQYYGETVKVAGNGQWLWTFEFVVKVPDGFTSWDADAIKILYKYAATSDFHLFGSSTVTLARIGTEPDTSNVLVTQSFPAGSGAIDGWGTLTIPSENLQQWTANKLLKFKVELNAQAGVLELPETVTFWLSCVELNWR